MRALTPPIRASLLPLLFTLFSRSRALAASPATRVVQVNTVCVLTLKQVCMQRRRWWWCVISIAFLALLFFEILVWGFDLRSVVCRGEDVMDRSSVDPVVRVGSDADHPSDLVERHATRAHQTGDQESSHDVCGDEGVEAWDEERQEPEDQKESHADEDG